MKKTYRIAAISGSLRKNSYNTMALKVAQKIAPQNIVIDHLIITDIPLYNFDLHEKEIPVSVENICNAIKSSDAVMFFVPEYNYSVSGALKNTIDFISRSPLKPLDMKAVGIMGASLSLLGTARAQSHLRQILTAVNAYVMNSPEIMISEADKKFDKEGNLTCKETKKLMIKFIISLASLSEKINTH
ncbi:MAG: NAD(P)H-dependent oxidoreductase [Bacteroidia bacterium]|nr:NAD(P)H-dependent oxidoreductase [Bacteroidia bacterium]